MLKLQNEGRLAQLVERHIHIVKVTGSNPVPSTSSDMNIIKLLLTLTLLSLIPGQLIRIPISGAVITISDITVSATVAISAIYLFTIKKSIKLNPIIAVPALIFTLFATTSTILSLNVFSKMAVVTSSLFLFRFLLYFFISIIVSNLVEKKEIESWLNIFIITVLVYTTLGFIQLAVFPDLSFLVQYGWDPHIQRLVSSLLDPNFSGGLITFAIAVAMSLFLKNGQKKYLLACAIFFTGIVLTFSRSSYLALIAAFVVIGVLKSPKLLGVFVLIGLFSYFAIPQVKSRVEGAFSLDETAQARIESWQKAIVIFSNNPVFGVGFNTYRYAQENYGFFAQTDPTGGHSGAGSDSSILLVLATTGTVGAVFYLYFLISILKVTLKGITKNYLHIATLASFVALIVHSQFVNSLFFPQIMLAFWFIFGLVLVNDENHKTI